MKSPVKSTVPIFIQKVEAKKRVIKIVTTRGFCFTREGGAHRLYAWVFDVRLAFTQDSMRFCLDRVRLI